MTVRSRDTHTVMSMTVMMVIMVVVIMVIVAMVFTVSMVSMVIASEMTGLSMATMVIVVVIMSSSVLCETDKFIYYEIGIRSFNCVVFDALKTIIVNSYISN